MQLQGQRVNPGDQPRRMKLKGRVSRVGESRDAYRVLVGKVEGKRPFTRHRVDGRIILERILKKNELRGF